MLDQRDFLTDLAQEFHRETCGVLDKHLVVRRVFLVLAQFQRIFRQERLDFIQAIQAFLAKFFGRFRFSRTSCGVSTNLLLIQRVKG